MVTSMYVRKNAIARKSMSLILAASLAGGAMSTYAFADEAGDGSASGTIATQSLTKNSDGSYKVGCSVLKADSDVASGAADYVNKTVTIAKASSGYTMDISVDSANISQLKYKNAEGEFVDAENISEDTTTGTAVWRTLSTSVPSEMYIQIYIVPMAQWNPATAWQTCRVVVDSDDYNNVVSTESSVNKSALNAAIASANAAIANADRYTEDSIANLQTQLELANRAAANENIPQQGVNAVTKQLQAAIDALELRAVDLTNRELQDGIYAISVDMYKTDKQTKSMADDAINHIAKLEVKDGKYYMTLDFNGITIENRFGYLAQIAYYVDGYTFTTLGAPQGELAAATVLSTQKNSDGTDVIDQYNSANALYPDIVTFELVSTARTDADGYAALQVYVPIMEDIATGNGTQNVLMKLDWDSVRATTADDPAFAPGEADDAALSPVVNVTDDATGITVNAAKGVLPEGATLVVSALTEGADYATAQAALAGVANKFALYEVHFVDVASQVVQPNGTVEVSYPIPADFDQTKVALYRINDDGTKTKIDGEVKDGKYVVNTKSFSKYALVELNAEGEAATAGATTLASGAATSLAGSATSSSLATTGDEAGNPVAPLAATAAGASLLAAIAAFVTRRTRKTLN
jgi:heme-binding NEAT domain protein